MQTLQSIKIISDQNEINLPTEDELSFFIEKKYIPTLYLDANICLFLLNYYNGNPIRDEIKNDILILIEYFQNNRITILPDYGVFELVYDKTNYFFNKIKYDEIIEKILYSFQLPISIHKKGFKQNLFEVTYPSDYTSHNKINKWGAFYFVSYTTILKIYSIAKKSNPSKNTLKKNLTEFLKWCDEAIDTSMGLELSLSLKIFGGDSAFKKMIDLDGKKGSDFTFKSIKGTVWDLIHIRLIHDSLTSESMKSYLVTDDKNLNTLFKSIGLESVSFLKNGSSINKLTDNSSICYSDQKLKNEIDELLMTFFEMRENKIDGNSARPEISTIFKITKDLELEILNNA